MRLEMTEITDSFLTSFLFFIKPNQKFAWISLIDPCFEDLLFSIVCSSYRGRQDLKPLLLSMRVKMLLLLSSLLSYFSKTKRDEHLMMIYVSPQGSGSRNQLDHGGSRLVYQLIQGVKRKD